MFVKPAPSIDDPSKPRAVRTPRTHAFLPPEGQEVPEDSFWTRRIIQGDVVLATPGVPVPPTAAEKGPES